MTLEGRHQTLTWDDALRKCTTEFQHREYSDSVALLVLLKGRWVVFGHHSCHLLSCRVESQTYVWRNNLSAFLVPLCIPSWYLSVSRI
ncbi:hypothetical protein V6N13_083768 [Hibiscus sabdariffa]|uniref:Uncharacterized protein n=1 Tax=Hibiscus sabdariffa TaxID=183260 RepID=A0ABR2SZR9_9ROSI